MMDDRNVEPDYFWLFQKYTNYILGKYGDMSGPNVYLRARERINSYNEKNGKILAKITEERETALATIQSCSTSSVPPLLEV